MMPTYKYSTTTWLVGSGGPSAIGPRRAREIVESGESLALLFPGQDLGFNYADTGEYADRSAVFLAHGGRGGGAGGGGGDLVRLIIAVRKQCFIMLLEQNV